MENATTKQKKPRYQQSGQSMPGRVGSLPAYEESKKNIGIAITPKSAEYLRELANEMGISRSELFERIGQKRILLQFID